MARTKRRKRNLARKPPKKPVGAQRPSADDKENAIVAKRIAGINLVLAGIALVPGFYIFFLNVDRARATLGNVFYVFEVLAVVLCVSSVGLYRLSMGKFGPRATPTDNAKYRKIGVWHVTITTFLNIVVVIPALYINGYLTRLIALVPWVETLNGKLSLSLAFVAGAVVSGVLGNFAYDVLKFIFKRMAERNDG